MPTVKSKQAELPSSKKKSVNRYNYARSYIFFRTFAARFDGSFLPLSEFKSMEAEDEDSIIWDFICEQ